jgi:hypothetical protein
MDRTVLLHWRGFDPTRVEAAHVTLGSDSLEAHGTSLTASYALDYSLVTGPGWVTRELQVRVHAASWWRSLVLQRGHRGGWTASWDGDADEARATGLPDLEAALDCDLGLCPLTNTMPIRRLDLVGAAHRGQRGSHHLVMAWVSVPDLEVHRAEQDYAVGDAVVSDGHGALVSFASDGFSTSLEVDANGLVVNYPGLARRLEALG